jgi:tetraacyldisaccharide 4'-kinase
LNSDASPRAPGTSGAVQRLQRAWLSRGLLARALWPLSMLFATAAALRRSLYRAGLLHAQAVAAPVIVVGNLIAGGAGKTPVVMDIVQRLRAQGYTPGIVSRGYGASATQPLDVRRDTRALDCGDEPLLLHLRTHTPVVVCRDRVMAAQFLLKQHPTTDVIVSDDGLQHLRLARDAQVLVFDERGAGNGWLLPAGPLRETVPDAVPARSLVVYNADTESTTLRGALARRSLAGVVSLPDWWQGRPASRDALDALRGRPVLAAAGLAHPERFFGMLRANGLTITPLLPDHFDYAALPWPHDAADVIVTEKDAIKLDASRAGSTRIWVAPLDLALDAAFHAALTSLLPPPRKPSDGNATA